MKPGNLKTITDARGEINAVWLTRGSAPTALASNIHYRADGQIRYMDYGHGKGETRSYDLKGRLTTQDIQDIYRQTYTYDANGNLTTSAIDYINGTVPDVSLTGTYDALDRLTQETGPTAAGYVYDANGNRLSQNSTTYQYLNASNRLTQAGGSAFTTDAAGNLLSDGIRMFSYAPWGWLESVTTTEGTTWYGYNLQGQRTRKVLPSGQILLYHYDEAGHLLAETNETGTPIKSYVWLDDMPLAQIDHSAASDAIYILHADHLATPRLATTLPGGTVWRWEGSAFGDIQPIGSVTINLRFPGQYYDGESGLYYNWNRYYDPGTGRYITSDPIGLEGGLNTYRYAENNPLRYTDPTGLSSFDDFGDWLDKEATIQGTLNAEGTQFLEDWGNFVVTWGEISGAALGTLSCPTPKKIPDICKKAALGGVLLLGICQGTPARPFPRDQERLDKIREATQTVPRRNTGAIPHK